MRTTELGSTGLKVSAIGLGAMPLSITGRPDEGTAIKVVHKALELGATIIDTADSYCLDENDKHHNEAIIAKALASYTGDKANVIVATKGGLVRPQGRWERNGDPDHLRKTIKESFDVLGGVKPIDVWQYHAPDPQWSIKESLSAVIEAQKNGIVKHIGVSNFSVDQIKEARSVCEIVSVQNQYSPWERTPEFDGVIQYCEAEKITFLPWSPLGGMRRAKSLDQYPEIASIAAGKNVSPQQVVLAWCMAKSKSILPIPGASRVSSIEDSLKAVDLQLSKSEIAGIDQISG